MAAVRVQEQAQVRQAPAAALTDADQQAAGEGHRGAPGRLDRLQAPRRHLRRPAGCGRAGSTRLDAVRRKAVLCGRIDAAASAPCCMVTGALQ